MHYRLDLAPFAVLWLSWLAFWIFAARNVKATRRREPFASFLLSRAVVTVGALLLAFRCQRLHWLAQRFVAPLTAVYWLGLLMIAVGLGFAVWARITLGRNWSGTVTVKQNHELIRTGPYHLVRHPIYSGMLLALLGTGIAIGEWRGLMAFAAIAFGLVIKIRTEERFMIETFGEQYIRYRTEVPALIPFIGRARPAGRQPG